MPDFMVMVTANEAEEARLSPFETKALVEGYSDFERKLRAALAYLDGERLRPSAEGRRVSLRDGDPHIEVGPFETPLVGYYLIEAASLEEALALTEGCPMPPGTSLDVRPVMKGNMKPGKTDQQGRVFAFAILGSAATEEGWTSVMDRIDESTRDVLPTGRGQGGVRLHAPGRGRRVTEGGGQRAIFDGPFLESKEVIGGLCFVRMSTIDEAVRWATATAFVKYGVVEIRELWRS